MDSSKLKPALFSSSVLKWGRVLWPRFQNVICEGSVKRAIATSLSFLSYGLHPEWKGKEVPFVGRSGKAQTSAELVRATRKLLLAVAGNLMLPNSKKWARKLQKLTKHIAEMKFILYGSDDCEPVAMACEQLTQEVFRDDTMTLLCMCLPKLNSETRNDVTMVVVNLQHQPVQSHLIASDYLEANKELLDFLVCSYESMDNALHYSRILRECIRHRSVAKYILESDNLRSFFTYIDLPNFDIASDAAATFKELLTRHKLIASEFLATNYSWFFTEFNVKLLQSSKYITRRMAVKLLGDILLDRYNATVTMRYTSSKENLQILMNLLIESSRSIQIAAFHVFKAFVVNEDKSPEIVRILVINRTKLLKLFKNLTTGKEDVEFDQDKAYVVKEIAGLLSSAENQPLDELLWYSTLQHATNKCPDPSKRDLND